jgi:hypothetical protein
MTDKYIGRRIRLTRNVASLWDSAVFREGAEGVIVKVGDSGDLFHVKLDDGPEVWFDSTSFIVLAEATPEALVQTFGTITIGMPQQLEHLWRLQDQVGHVFASITPTLCLNFGPDISINYGVSPPKVELRGATPDAAARAFWNAVHAVVGREPLFP